MEVRADAGVDPDTREWLGPLRGEGPRRDAAIARLHDLLLRAARFEVARRRATLPHLRGESFDDLATQSADDALVAVLAKLDDFRGESRFTTWAYKFALLEAAVRLRRLSWQHREVPLEPASWDGFAGGRTSPHDGAETRELFDALRIAIDERLTPHQREVLVATTLRGVPIDVLAERLGTTRGALYKTLHGAKERPRLARLLTRLAVALLDRHWRHDPQRTLPLLHAVAESQPLLEAGHEPRATFRLQRHKQLVGQRVTRQPVARARPHPALPALRRQQLLGRLAQPLAVLSAPAVTLHVAELPMMTHDDLLVRARPLRAFAAVHAPERVRN